jgi:hypothetical protein
MKIRLTESQFTFIKEALGDDIPDYMKDIIKKRYNEPEKLLQRDVPKHTDVIPSVKVEVKDENITNKTITELIEYFTQNIVDQFSKSLIYNLYYDSVFADRYSPMSPLAKLLSMSLPQSNLLARDDKYKYSKFIKNFTWLYSKEFRLPVTKDNDINKPIFSKNKSTLATFLKTAIRAFPNELNDIDVNAIITDKHFVGLREPIINYQTNIKKIKDSKLYLYITDRPDDKLRMSISLFYDSCQNIYTGGEQGTQYNKKLLSNVFDENSKVAYLIFNSPFKDKMGNDHPFTSIARTILRVNNEGGVMFDKVYPGDMEGLFYKIIEDKTGLENVGKSGDIYHYKGIAGLPAPYMDRYSIKNVGEVDSESYYYINALSHVVNFNPKDLIALSDNTFKIGEQEWSVYTNDEALEVTRDFYRDDYIDMLYDRDFSDLISYGIFDSYDIESELDIDSEEMEKSGYNDLGEYLNEMFNIETFQDFYNAVKNSRGTTGAAQTWLNGHVNIDAIIEYFGGEYEAMSYALSSYDGDIHEVGDYVVVRRN